eukprot:10675275-Alexandrium_andersonii.AAC.1
MSASLVGSEMCIRDSPGIALRAAGASRAPRWPPARAAWPRGQPPLRRCRCQQAPPRRRCRARQPRLAA